MRRFAVVAAAGVVAGSLAALSPGQAVPPGGVAATVQTLPDRSSTRLYPVHDASGKRVGDRAWTVTNAGGNCCEVYVAATPTGRLLEFGGGYPTYSDDRGQTWHRVSPTTPIVNGEGAISAAPGGDIVGIGWDPYGGDHLQSFHYDGESRKWTWAEVPLHEPFYDRQWVAVAKGPFTINGAKVPWVSIVLSNYHRSRNVSYMSTDGINYFQPSQRQLDAIRNGTVTGYLPTKPDPELDYTQAQAKTGLTMLSQYALSFDDTRSCTTHILKSDGSWACYQLPNEVQLRGPMHTDSRGWLHEVYQDAETMVYRISRDGGRKWVERRFTFPGQLVPETWDFKAHGKLGLTAIAAHVEKEDGTFQDMVMRINTRTGAPVLERTYFVGDGNLKSTVGLDATTLVSGKSNRVDFTSVAILPNGKIAVSFADAKFDDPAVAVLA